MSDIDRLKALVAKLPVYTDTGEPFVPGRDRCWVVHEHEYGPETRHWRPFPGSAIFLGNSWQVALQSEEDNYRYGEPMPSFGFYSSEDAAQGAIDKREQQ